MATWALAEAKAKFSELVNRAVHQEPQEITRNGKPVVVMVSQEDWLRAKKTSESGSGSMANFFRRSPLKNSGIDLARRRSSPRKVEL